MMRVFLCCLLLIAPATSTKAGGFLASGRGRSSLAKRRAWEERLRNSMSQLTSTLSSQLHGKSSGGTNYSPGDAAEARDLLLREADGLQFPDHADLLRDFADRAPAYVLLVPVDYQNRETGKTNHDVQQDGPFGHAVSESSVFRTDGNGHTFSQTTRCRDGHCKTTNSTKGMNGADETNLVNTSGVPPAHVLDRINGFHSQSHSLHDAVEQMTKEMKAMENSFGRDSLRDTMDSIFHDAGKRHHSSKSLANAKAGQSSSTGALSDSWAKSLANASNVESVTSQTRIKNGKRITVKKTCKNGHCKKETVEEDLDQSGNDATGDDDAMDQQMAPLFFRSALW